MTILVKTLEPTKVFVPFSNAVLVARVLLWFVTVVETVVRFAAVVACALLTVVRLAAVASRPVALVMRRTLRAAVGVPWARRLVPRVVGATESMLVVLNR
ncbi:MAG: hypothetical protein EBS05_26295 [Proteobacteria bacterium]|nr:hypothetical protein [Pseudomonadota bacterium]